jgi:hypothetical protein
MQRAGFGAFLVGIVALGGALAVVPRAVAAQAEGVAGGPTLEHVDWYDGSTWKAVAMSTGAVDGPAEGSSQKARFQSRIGGPKSFFVVAGPTSETAVTEARPRFRINGDAATARRVQLAAREVLEENRVTPSETAKGLSVFKKGVALEVSRVKDDLWELRPKKSLQPGEYLLAISADGPIAVFTIAARGY